MKSLHESYWPFIYIIYHLLFQTFDFKLTLSWHRNHCRSSHKWQMAIIVFFARCMDTLIWLHCYIFFINLFYFMNCSLEHNIYWFCLYYRKVGMFFVSVFDLNLFIQFDWFYFSKIRSRCLSLTDHVSTLFLFTFSKIWLETDSPMPLQLLLL